MMQHSTKRPTKQEAARIARFVEIGCVVCRLSVGLFQRHYEVHHLLNGGKRMGHWFSIPLCRGHHQGKWPQWEVPPPVSLADGRKAFLRAYGFTERELWEEVQKRLGLSIEWVPTKVLPRRVA